MVRTVFALGNCFRNGVGALNEAVTEGLEVAIDRANEGILAACPNLQPEDRSVGVRNSMVLLENCDGVAMCSEFDYMAIRLRE